MKPAPTSGPARVLVVDDDRPVRDSLRRALQLRGYRVSLAADGMEAIRRVTAERPDLVVLDVMMPGVDGFGVLRRLRQDGFATPILLLTARDAVDDRVAGLTSGADDYLVKPFALEELVARIEALLRRTSPAPPAAVRVLRFADLSVDLDSAEVFRGDVRLELTRTEYDLLVTFLENPRRVLSITWRLTPAPLGMDLVADLEVLMLGQDHVGAGVAVVVDPVVAVPTGPAEPDLHQHGQIRSGSARIVMARVVLAASGMISSPGMARTTSSSVAPQRCCHGWITNR